MDRDGSTQPRPREAVQDRVMLQDLAAELFGDTASQPVEVGRYLVLERIGMGGMGVVLKAYDPKLDRRVALKVLRPDVHVDAAARERLQREAKGLAKLNHPNAVVIHEVGTEGGEVFLAMEFVDGVDLARWAQRNPVHARGRRAEAQQLLVEAAEGLAAAHQAGLVHRDVKPSNVLVGRDGRARVADFGLAHAVGAQETTTASIDTGPLSSSTGTVGGTPHYMSPEQQAEKTVDAASDQFSFCVAAWEVLFGERPWPDLPTPEQPPPRPSWAPAWLMDVLQRGMALDPADRFGSMRALIRALADDPSRRRRTRRWIAMGVGAAAIVGGIAAYRDATRCDAGPAALAEVWNDRARADVGPSIADEVDAYAEKWRSVHAQACETEARGALGCLAFEREVLTTALYGAPSVGLRGELSTFWGTLADPERCAVAPEIYALPRDPRAVLQEYRHVLQGEGWDARSDHPVIRMALAAARAETAVHADPSAAVDHLRAGYREALGHGDDLTAARFAARLARGADSDDRGVEASLWRKHAALLDPGSMAPPVH